VKKKTGQFRTRSDISDQVSNTHSSKIHRLFEYERETETNQLD